MGPCCCCFVSCACCAAAGLLEDALPLLESAVEEDPTLAQGWELCGVVRAQRGDHGAGLRDCSRALELEPSASAFVCFWHAFLIIGAPL